MIEIQLPIPKGYVGFRQICCSGEDFPPTELPAGETKYDQFVKRAALLRGHAISASVAA